jgi:hypothetical protein
MRRDLQLSGYPSHFIDSVLNFTGSGHPEERRNSLVINFIPYVKGISEKFRCICGLL